jgi:hypothetical protein
MYESTEKGVNEGASFRMMNGLPGLKVFETLASWCGLYGGPQPVYLFCG